MGAVLQPDYFYRCQSAQLGPLQNCWCYVIWIIWHGRASSSLDSIAVVIFNCLCCCLVIVIVVVVVVVVSSSDSGYRQEEDSGRPEEDAGGRSRCHFHGVQGTDLCECLC